MAHSIGNRIVLGDGVCSEGIDILLDLVLKCKETESEVFGGDGSRKIVRTKERKLGREDQYTPAAYKCYTTTYP